MQAGVYSGITNHEYHGGEGVSKSMLDVLHRQSPQHLLHTRTQTHREPTAAQALGTAAHALILEPEMFDKEYVRAVDRADHPHAVADRDALVYMVQELNKSRLPKLPVTGTKDELIARIEQSGAEKFALQDMSVSDLKATITALNVHRQGLYSTSGNMAELADILSENSRPVTLWNDIKAAWQSTVGDRIALSAEEWKQLHDMRDAVYAHTAAYALLRGGEGVAEQSVYWVDEDIGVLCRCRPDYWRNDIAALIDLKTTDDASPDGFAKSIMNWRYHVQHPFYVDGVNAAIEQSGNKELKKIQHFVFIAVEKKPPHAVAVYVLDANSVDIGRAEYKEDLAKYDHCQAQNLWPGYGDKIQNISLPQFYINKQAGMLEKL